jgi:hypothetical protein
MNSFLPLPSIEQVEHFHEHLKEHIEKIQQMVDDMPGASIFIGATAASADSLLHICHRFYNKDLVERLSKEQILSLLEAAKADKWNKGDSRQVLPLVLLLHNIVNQLVSRIWYACRDGVSPDVVTRLTMTLFMDGNEEDKDFCTSVMEIMQIVSTILRLSEDSEP